MTWKPKRVFFGCHFGIGTQGLTDGITDALRNHGVEVLACPYTQMSAERVIGFNPDFLLVLHGYEIANRNVFMNIGRAGILRVLFTSDDPYCLSWTAMNAPGCFDAIVTNDRGCIPAYQRLGFLSACLPFAHDPKIHYPGPRGAERRYDVLLSGSRWPERMRVLTPLFPWLRTLRTCLLDQWYAVLDPIDGTQVDRHYPSYTPAPVLAEFYRQTKVVVNIHRDSHDENDPVWGMVPRASHINPRQFEASACGAVSVFNLDRRDWLEYLPGCGDLVFDGTSDGLRAVIERALGDRFDELSAAAVAAARQHDWTARMGDLFELVEGWRAVGAAASRP